MSYYIDRDLWSIVIKRKLLQSVTNLQMPGLWPKMRGPFFSHHSLVYLFLIKYFSETVYEKEVETHFGVYFWFVWTTHTTVFPKEFSSKHNFSNHPCRHFESSYSVNLHKVFPGLTSCDLWVNNQSRIWMPLVFEMCVWRKWNRMKITCKLNITGRVNLFGQSVHTWTKLCILSTLSFPTVTCRAILFTGKMLTETHATRRDFSCVFPVPCGCCGSQSLCTH